MGGKNSGRPGGNPELIAQMKKVRLYSDAKSVQYSLKVHPRLRAGLRRIGADKVRRALEALIENKVIDE